MLRTWLRVSVALSGALFASSARAEEPPPLPPAEEPSPAEAPDASGAAPYVQGHAHHGQGHPPPGYGQPPPGRAAPLPPGYGQPAYGAEPAYLYPPARRRPAIAPEEEGAHAPKYALWAGGRLSYVGFGLSFFDNERGEPETTGNFLGNGVAPQIDVGARISHRYVPYVFWEHGFMGKGRRFAAVDATSSMDFYGVGFRYLSGDVDSVAFLTDLSIGQRVIRVSSGGQTYTMSGLEYFRLGLGAEIRVATLLSLSPLLSVSSGTLNDSDGDVTFGCTPGGCGDGLSHPTYVNGKVIQSARAYVVLSLGVGAHFDLFGK